MNHTTRNVLIGLVALTVLIIFVIITFYDDLPGLGRKRVAPATSEPARSSVSNTDSTVILGDIEADVNALEQEYNLGSTLETDILQVPDFQAEMNEDL